MGLLIFEQKSVKFTLEKKKAGHTPLTWAVHNCMCENMYVLVMLTETLPCMNQGSMVKTVGEPRLFPTCHKDWHFK